MIFISAQNQSRLQSIFDIRSCSKLKQSKDNPVRILVAHFRRTAKRRPHVCFGRTMPGAHVGIGLEGVPSL